MHDMNHIKKVMRTATTEVCDWTFGSESKHDPITQLQSGSVCLSVQEKSDTLLKNNCMLCKTKIKWIFPKDLQSNFSGCKFFTFNVTSKSQVSKVQPAISKWSVFINHYSKQKDFKTYPCSKRN